MRGVFAIMLLVSLGCATPGSRAQPAVSPEQARRVYVAPLEIEPAEGPEPGARFARRLAVLVSARVQALGHVLSSSAATAQVALQAGVAHEFHPGGDVKRVRVFVRVEANETLLDDWAREPLNFYFIPPTESDLEALADEICARLVAALLATPQKSMMH